MNNKPKWIIFDVGNVLYDFISFNKEMIKITGINEVEFLKSIDPLTRNTMEGQISATDLFKKYLDHFDKSHKHQEIVRIWKEEEKYWLSDTKKLIGELDKVGYKIAILTNNWLNQTEMLRKNLSSAGNIQFFIESSVEKISKPDKKIYRLAEDRINAKGDEIFFIDDTKEYIMSASEINWQTFLYKIGDDNGLTSNNNIRSILL